jgi:hypothetical protein
MLQRKVGESAADIDGQTCGNHAVRNPGKHVYPRSTPARRAPGKGYNAHADLSQN